MNVGIVELAASLEHSNTFFVRDERSFVDPYNEGNVSITAQV
jgi:hypothetical protein